MSYINGNTEVKPGIPFPLTSAWWHNRCYSKCNNKGDCLIGHCGHISEWVKALSFSGNYPELFKPGTHKYYPYWNATGHHIPDRGRPWDGDEHGHQKAIILGRIYRYFVVDVDNGELYEEEADVTQFVTYEMRTCASRPGHWHALVFVPDDLMHLWPDRDVPGANIRGTTDGFVPVPGCWHYSGSQYEPNPDGRILTATEPMLRAILGQRITPRAAAAGYSGSGAVGRQGELLLGLRELPLGTSREEAERWWWAAYDEKSKEPGTDGTYHSIDPDPAGLCERQLDNWDRHQAQIPAWMNGRAAR